MTGRPRMAQEFQSILDHCGDNVGRLPYQEKKPGEKFSTAHIGQRKLFLSEVGFLLEIDPQQYYTVVYAGAAPGIHIPFLARMFPRVTFHLYDPRPFDIQGTGQIILHQCYFTDEIAQAFAGTENLLFVCDIRRTTAETEIWEDMLAQQKWHEIMRPERTSLKFRLPWVEQGQDPIVHYLNGDIHLPVWGRTSTTECRLVIDKQRHGGKRPYDCLIYEQEMSYFNRITRPSVHERLVRGGGFDGCYDCFAEVRILQGYLFGGFSRRWRATSVVTLSNEISRCLGRGIQGPQPSVFGGDFSLKRTTSSSTAAPAARRRCSSRPQAL